ncbi:unnamed protein product [Oikopleura dioica]|uniref:Uncharacterized protein n=1 Tax=Oikopleura dioica TaxID=34765 RepID=E4XZQ7_OIKDI|nr:unnamed protein product [Oikopleura dioica]
MSINKDDLFLAIKKEISITREYLNNRLRKKNLHTSKKCEKAIREILKKNPGEIVKNIEGHSFISVDEIVEAVKTEIFTGRTEVISVRVIPGRAKIEYKRFNLEDKESILSLIKHPDLPKSKSFIKNSMTQCFGCNWQATTVFRNWDKKRKTDELKNQLINHYRNEITKKYIKFKNKNLITKY